MLISQRLLMHVGMVCCGLLGSSRAMSVNVERAKAAETEAFRAVEAEAWCDALHLFVFAHQAAPSVDLIWNAAQAADLAQDRKEALKLYLELLGAYPKSERAAHVRERIGVLSAQVADEGRGKTCPVPAAIDRMKAATADAESPHSGEQPVGAAPAAVGGKLSSDAVHSRTSQRFWPFVTVAVGVGSMLVGGGITAVGAMPYSEFMSAREAILAAESNASDAASFHGAQKTGRENWERWGAPSVVAGIALIGTGIIAALSGGVWAILAADTEDGERAP